MRDFTNIDCRNCKHWESMELPRTETSKGVRWCSFREEDVTTDSGNCYQYNKAIRTLDEILGLE